MSPNDASRARDDLVLPADLTTRFIVAGIAMIEFALTKADLDQMDALILELAPQPTHTRNHGLRLEAQAWLACHRDLNDLATRLSGGLTRLSRIEAFDTLPMTNWFVPWHQDRAERGERPLEQLERTVALRIYLDECCEDHGPLEVLPGSHTAGRLQTAAIDNWVASRKSLLCLAVRGDIVAMRPLLVHRSQRARIPSACRVLHLEYERVL